MSEEKPTIYLRNLRETECRVTITGGRKIELKPRGQRGDMASIDAKEQTDQKVLVNVGYIWEPITKEQADEIEGKQDINRKEPRDLLSYITNERGEKYEQPDAIVEKSFEEQGEVVGRVQEQDSHRSQQSRTEVVRSTENAAPEKVEVPGSVAVEDSHYADEKSKVNPDAPEQSVLSDLRANSEVAEVTKGA